MTTPIPAVHYRLTEVTVSAIPEGNVNHTLYSVKVQWRGGETYAVERHGQVLGSDGEWDYEPLPSSREDDWIATHRFTYDRAHQLACEAATHVVVNGFTVADVLARSAGAR